MLVKIFGIWCNPSQILYVYEGEIYLANGTTIKYKHRNYTKTQQAIEEDLLDEKIAKELNSLIANSHDDINNN